MTNLFSHSTRDDTKPLRFPQYVPVMFIQSVVLCIYFLFYVTFIYSSESHCERDFHFQETLMCIVINIKNIQCGITRCIGGMLKMTLQIKSRRNFSVSAHQKKKEIQSHSIHIWQSIIFLDRTGRKQISISRLKNEKELSINSEWVSGYSLKKKKNYTFFLSVFKRLLIII